MSAPTRETATRPAPAARPGGPRGMAWLMVRQHRFTLLFWTAATLAAAAWLVYQRSAMLDDLRAAGRDGRPVFEADPNLFHRIGEQLNSAGAMLGGLPVLLGAFLGAPLIASDREQGTARLVTTQSFTRTRWLLWKLGFAVVVVVATTLPLSLLYARWSRAAGPAALDNWLDSPVFDVTGPVLVASALCTTALGIAVGALARRAVIATMLTFVASGALMTAIAYLRPGLATPRRLVYPFGADRPGGYDGSVEVDRWISTASGELYGWSTCVHDAEPEGCRARLGIVNSVQDYVGHDQMAGMQWATAGVFLALAALLVTAFLLRTRRGAL
ncbi:ABC transporter permease [Streptomyces subrutilus]|uniref:ABC transporter permease n=1 Tax=Streptomyces subrutilus TaxID=36818 RepID=UPI0033FD38AF